MVSWGQNTTHTIGSPAPAASGFGAAPAPTFGTSPAPAPAFGASPAPAFGAAPAGGLFGAPKPAAAPAFGAPAPAGGSLFGSSPAPTPGTGFFGSSPAPASGGLFGSAPAPTSLFGNAPAPGTSLFGAPAPSTGLFGSQTQQPQQQQVPQIPAQAALQAHMDASARQEEQRVCTALEKIHRAYQGTDPATESTSAKFTSVAYDPATPQIRQQQWLHGMGYNGEFQPIAPPQPPQFCQADWHQAVLRNPDYQNCMPVPMVGASALMARATSQQTQVTNDLDRLQALEETQQVIQRRHQESLQKLDQVDRRSAVLSQRLLNAMRKVEIARCLNHPLQESEVAAMTRLQELSHQVEQVRHALEGLNERTMTAVQQRPVLTDIPEDERLRQALTEQRTALSNLAVAVQRDKRDVELIHQRVRTTTRVPVPRIGAALAK